MTAFGFWFLSNRSNIETAKQNLPSTFQPEQQPKQNEEKPPANTNKEIAAVNSASQFAVPLPTKTPPKRTANNQPADAPKPEKTIAPPKIFVASFVLSPSMRGGS